MLRNVGQVRELSRVCDHVVELDLAVLVFHVRPPRRSQKVSIPTQRVGGVTYALALMVE